MSKMDKTERELKRARAARRFSEKTLHQGRTSTLKKTMRFYRDIGGSPEVNEEERSRHIHPRHKRPAIK